ncbi:MAG: hypothetical protein U5K38_09805 [Woeseiaceae bacterium]|nr:hypothetical protein [Woeseiaceae bacterium]
MRRAAIDVVREATRRVSIFTHDLEPGIYDDPDFLEVVKHLVLSQTYARIRVLIADPARAIKNGNAFVQLGRRLNTYIEFRHVREDLRTHPEAFCIADGTALVYRLQANRWKVSLIPMNLASASITGSMFDEIWQASEVENRIPPAWHLIPERIDCDDNGPDGCRSRSARWSVPDY